MPLRPLVSAAIVLFAAPAWSAEFPDYADLPAKAEYPDPLLLGSGGKVATKEQWFAERRPELKRIFEHYMYGHAPPAPAKVESRVLFTDKEGLGGKATVREVALTLGPAPGRTVHVLLIVPNKRSGSGATGGSPASAVPVFVGLNFYGNHAVLKDTKISLPKGWVPPRGGAATKDGKPTEEGRGSQLDVWNAELIVDRGYALATVYCGDIEPDKADAADGIRKLYVKADGTPEYDWGAIRAWAWGLSRVVDYLVTDGDIDKDHIAVVGHSRLGKTALLAAAMDERFALAIPSQAGCGGTAPSRGKVGEPVERINKAFPHWFNAEYKKFGVEPARLPFDQHELVAMVAPRPVLLSNAVEDTWANPAGQFDVLKAADPVYKLLGAGGLDSDKQPEVGTLSAGKLGYFIRPGKHSMSTLDWQTWLDYADKHFGRKGR